MKWLGGIALILVVIGLVFPSISAGFADERLRNGVIILAIPFVAVFIAILLIYILAIVLLARRFNRKIPNRVHRPIELLLIAGILGGVVFLFQSLNFVGYRYGFLLLLVSLLGFIVWSHVTPKSARLDADLPPLTPAQNAVGLVAALIVLIVLAGAAISANQPQEPYGVRQRVWNTYDDARKAQIAEEALSSFNNVEVPFLIILNLFPCALIFLVVRELAGGVVNQPARKLRAAT
jgi:cytochrome c biogenesis factor